MKKGTTVIRDPEMRRVRALAMIQSRIRGASYADLAKEFKVSTETVQRVLSWGKKAGLIVDAEDKILQELVPKALGVVAKVLDKENVSDREASIALRILQGALPGFGGKQAQPKTVGTEGDAEGDLYSYIDRIRKEMVIDGEHERVSELVEVPLSGLLPATTESVATQGLPDSTDLDGSGVTPANSPSGVEERSSGTNQNDGRG